VVSLSFIYYYVTNRGYEERPRDRVIQSDRYPGVRAWVRGPGGVPVGCAVVASAVRSVPVRSRPRTAPGAARYIPEIRFFGAG
jgi:hypothetical protein